MRLSSLLITSSGLTGITMLVGLWESLPTMKYYQLISIILTGVLCNILFWTSIKLRNNEDAKCTKDVSEDKN
jgi:hypothetical protein